MGYTNGFLQRLVFSEAFYLSAFGFVPALGLSLVLYTQAEAATQLPLEMTLERAAIVFAATVFMCTFSGVLAIRKLSKLDPADVF